MEAIKLFDAEWNLMGFIWSHEPVTASQAAAFALQNFGWKKNTTYTVIKRLIDKGVLRREEPGFSIVPQMAKADVQRAEVMSLLDRRFAGDINALLETLREAGRLT